APDERPRDPGLEAALRSEAPGILAWLVRGGLDHQRGGLQTPPSVKLARDIYRKEESIEPFLAVACVESELLAAEGGALYAAYESWCKANRLRVKSQVWFGKRLQERFEKGRTSNGRTCYYGLGLETTEFQPPTADNPSETTTTLQNPSEPFLMPNTASLDGGTYTVFEGLAPISNSFIEKNSPRVDLLDYPSDPSDPSEVQVVPSGIEPPAGAPFAQIKPKTVAFSASRAQELIESGMTKADAIDVAAQEFCTA